MITLHKNSSTIDSLCRISKLIKNDLESNPSLLQIDDVNNCLIFTLYGKGRISAVIKLDSNCFTLTNVKKKEISFDNAQLFQIISSNLNNDIQLEIDNGLKVKIGRKTMQLTSMDPIISSITPIIHFGKIAIDDLEKITHLGGVIATKNSVCVFNAGKVLTVDSIARRSLLISSLTNTILNTYMASFVDAQGVSQTNNIPINICAYFKDIVLVHKALDILLVNNWGLEANLIAKCPQYNTITSIGYEMSDPIFSNNKIQIFHPLLEDSIYQKEVKTIAHINRYTSTHFICVNIEEIVRGVTDAFYTSPESTLRITNKKMTDTMSILTHDGSFSDEISIVNSNCIFDISVKSGLINSIISNIKKYKAIEFMLNSSMPALCLSLEAGSRYFITCISNPSINIPFEVKDIKPAVVPINEKAPINQ